MPHKPWYPFYPADYRNDTFDLTAEQHGIYRCLIDLAWVRDGKLPADMDALKYLLQGCIRSLHGRTFKSYVPGILERYFFLHEDGFYHHSRVDFELGKASGISETNSKNAVDGRRKEAEKKQKKAENLQKKSETEPEMSDINDLGSAVADTSHSQHSTAHKEEVTPSPAPGGRPIKKQTSDDQRNVVPFSGSRIGSPSAHGVEGPGLAAGERERGIATENDFLSSDGEIFITAQEFRAMQPEFPDVKNLRGLAGTARREFLTNLNQEQFITSLKLWFGKKQRAAELRQSKLPETERVVKARCDFESDRRTQAKRNREQLWESWGRADDS